jgi:hypothetical protein
MMATGNKPLEVMNFATVVSTKKLREFGFEKGDEVLLISFKQAPISASDPYTKRDYALVARVEDGVVMLPNENSDDKVYLVDPSSLQAVSEERSNELISGVRKQFAT